MKQIMLSALLFITLLILIIAGIFWFGVSKFQRSIPKNNPYAVPGNFSELKYNCPNNNFFILSIDGGGTRGVIPLYFLSEFEKKTGKNISQLFNLVSGISTGAIIGSALLVKNKNNQPKYKAEDLLGLYINDSKNLFYRSIAQKIFTLDGIIGPKFSTKEKNKIFQKYYGQNKISDLLTGSVFYAYDASRKKIVQICGFKKCNELGKIYTVSELISGTTAPMSFFPPKLFMNNKGVVSAILNDASFSVSNPSILAYKLATRICPNIKRYYIVSIGTGFFPELNPNNQNIEYWGGLHWLPNIISTSMEEQLKLSNLIMDLIIEDHLANQSKGAQQVFYFRVNPIIDWNIAAPFNYRKKDLNELILTSSKYFKTHIGKMNCLVQLLRDRRSNVQCKKILMEQEE